MTTYKEVLKAVNTSSENVLTLVVSDDTNMLLIHGAMYINGYNLVFRNKDRSLMVFNRMEISSSIDVSILRLTGNSENFERDTMIDLRGDTSE